MSINSKMKTEDDFKIVLTQLRQIDQAIGNLDRWFYAPVQLMEIRVSHGKLQRSVEERLGQLRAKELLK